MIISAFLVSQSKLTFASGSALTLKTSALFPTLLHSEMVIQSSRAFPMSIFDYFRVSAAMNDDIAHFCLRKEQMLFSI